jgi:exonuclease SbcC
MKIEKIRIHNFKVFKDFYIDFNSSDAIVFDGPNGFGKTTVYDAIELLVTGEIRRYKTLKDGLIDNRQTFSENPFFYEGAMNGEDISIQIQFNLDGITHILERFALSAEIASTLDFGIYRLYIKDDFESEEHTLIANEKEYLSELFGANYERNFQFLNYVEQEECLFLLKNSDKKRKEYIAHLFDLTEFELKIKRIEEIKKRVDLLCNPARKTEVDDLEKEIKVISDTLLTEVSTTQYIRVFQNKEYVWDTESVDITKINYPSIAGDNGILDQLKLLILRKDIFKQYRKNRAVNFITENIGRVQEYFKYGQFIDVKDAFRTQRNELTTLLDLLQQLNALNSQNLVNTLDFTNYSFIPEILKTNFSIEKAELQNSLQELTGLDRIYADITVSRNLLKDKLLLLKDNKTANGECLFCGYDWGSVEELLIQIELRAEQIKEINSDKTTRFDSRFSQFKLGVLKEIIESINTRISTIRFDNVFVSELLGIERSNYNQILTAFEFLGFNPQRYINLQPSADIVVQMPEFTAAINALKVDIPEELIESYFQEILMEYFDGSHDAIDGLTIATIEQKQGYLKYLWTASQSVLLNTKNSALATMKQKYDDAKKTSSDLNVLKNKYNGSLKSFQKKIIKDIEIIFHVYSGRIMQCFQGGLGLFIFSEKEGIRFQSNPNKTYDAVFSMSSGQLSALIISFTLALHKKYALNKLILIDDPVQTMDELNLYGFIDLLRNEFAQDQIIMSTHEDMMSAFMRYKFKNYNFTEKRVNLKEFITA